METRTIDLGGRPLRVEVTPRARAALAARTTPLLAEMELYFSCLIRKAVRFREHDDDDGAVAAGDTLAVRFRPVMTASCSMADYERSPQLADFPIQRAGAFTPHWLRIDYRRGEWHGEFGYREAAA